MPGGLFDGCEAVVTRTIVNQRVAPAPMETRAAAAAWGEDGRLTAWIPNQGAQGTRAVLATMLEVGPAGVRVITPDVGGAFGAKLTAVEFVVLTLSGAIWSAAITPRTQPDPDGQVPGLGPGPARWPYWPGYSQVGVALGEESRMRTIVSGMPCGVLEPLWEFAVKLTFPVTPL